MSAPSKILVRTPNWIGDHVMARSFYRSLRSAYPHAHITLLLPESLSGFDHTAFADQIIPLTAQERKISKAYFAKAKQLRRENFDLAFSLPASFSAAFFLFLCGIKTRLGFSQDGGSFFYSSSIPWKGVLAGEHKSKLYLSLLEYATGHAFSLTEEKRDPSPKEKWIVISPGASISLREYPYFPESLKKISETYPHHQIIVVGAREQEKFKSQIGRLNLPNVEDRIGKTTLNEIVELCRKAEIVISNDSGVAHLSATLAGAETIVLFGPGNPDYIAPSGKAHALRIDLPCSPCEKPYCRAAYGYQACLKGLHPSTLLKQMKALTLHS